jgi:hypothetical protein
MMMHVARSEAMLPLVLAFATAVSAWSQVSTPLPANRQTISEKVARAAKLRGNEQVRAVRAILDDAMEGRIVALLELEYAVFRHERSLRPALRETRSDPKISRLAIALLGMIGEREDIRRLARALGRTKDSLTLEALSRTVATTIPDSASDDVWTVLRKAAGNAYNNGWADAQAIRTLKLLASPESAEILQEARERNPYRVEAIDEALGYIRSDPVAIVGNDLEHLAERVLRIAARGEWSGSKAPIFNEERDKALIEFEYTTEDCRWRCVATFHRQDKLWRLRSVSESMHSQRLDGLVVPQNQLPVPELLPLPPGVQP